MEAEAAARRWRDAWSQAWPEHDVDQIAALYTEDAIFRSAPVREPHRGASGVAEYARWAFEQEEAVEVRFGEPVASGNRAAVEYWAIVRSEGKEETLAGVSILRFAPEGRVEEERGYWIIKKRHPPPDGWGK